MILTALVNCFHPGRTVSTAVCWFGCMHVALVLILMYVWAVGTFRGSSCVLLRDLWMLQRTLFLCFHAGRTVSTAVCWSGCMHVALALILMYVWAVATFRSSSCVLLRYLWMLQRTLFLCFHPGRTVSTAVCWSGCMHVALALILMYVWAVATFRSSSCVLLRYLWMLQRTLFLCFHPGRTVSTAVCWSGCMHVAFALILMYVWAVGTFRGSDG